MNDTLKYYNKFAEAFIQSTVSVKFQETQNRFLHKLPKGAYILDFGCGSGRDTKWFMEHGCKVDAVDGSLNLCEMASAYTGIKVIHALFHDLVDIDKYDGIWACSSILHLTKGELVCVMEKMLTAIKSQGVIYTSFKYGEFEGIRNERHFTDFTEDTFLEFLQRFQGIKIEEQWITSDVRPNRGEEKWLNIILRKE